MTALQFAQLPHQADAQTEAGAEGLHLVAQAEVSGSDQQLVPPFRGHICKFLLHGSKGRADPLAPNGVEFQIAAAEKIKDRRSPLSPQNGGCSAK